MPDALNGQRKHRAKWMRRRKPLHIAVGHLDVEAFNCSDKVGPLWVPNGLHIRWKHRVLHLFWGSRGCSVTDLSEPFPTIPDAPARRADA